MPELAIQGKSCSVDEEETYIGIQLAFNNVNAKIRDYNSNLSALNPILSKTFSIFMNFYSLWISKHGNRNLAPSDRFKNITLLQYLGSLCLWWEYLEFGWIYNPLKASGILHAKYILVLSIFLEEKIKGEVFIKQKFIYLFHYNYIPCICLQNQFIQQIQVTRNRTPGRSTNRTIHNLFIWLLDYIPKQTHPFLCIISSNKNNNNKKRKKNSDYAQCILIYIQVNYELNSSKLIYNQERLQLIFNEIILFYNWFSYKGNINKQLYDIITNEIIPLCEKCDVQTPHCQ